MSDNTSTPDTITAKEISSWGKFLAGLLLIILTSAAIITVTAYWPNKMPPIKDGDDGAWYTRKWFNIILIEKSDCMVIHYNDSIHRVLVSTEDNITRLKDTIRIKDTIKGAPALDKLKDSLVALEALTLNLKKDHASFESGKRIHLNTILLILVALAGFLGNMVHIASSFTSFVGNGSFKRSWILWYCVKPFTAAGLAIIVYFIIRAGFLSYGTGAGGISLYGILALSAFAGLFTDSATLKLKEVFEVIFKPKDDRQDKLGDPVISVISVSPESIPPAVESTLTLKGTSLDTPDLKITFDGIATKAATATKDTIEIKYTPTAAAIAAAKTVLVVTDKSGKSFLTKNITINA